MSMFKFESISPFPNGGIRGESIGIVATYINDDPNRQIMSKEFMLFVGPDHVNVESTRSDGRTVHIRLHFDGERFIVDSETIKGKRTP